MNSKAKLKTEGLEDGLGNPDRLRLLVLRAALNAFYGSACWSAVARNLPIGRAGEAALVALLQADVTAGAVRAGMASTRLADAPKLSIGAPVALLADAGLTGERAAVAQALAEDLTAALADGRPWHGTPVLAAVERLSDALDGMNAQERFAILAALLFGLPLQQIGWALHGQRFDQLGDAAALILEGALDRASRWYRVAIPADGARWYVVQTHLHQERTAKVHLQNQRYEVYLPMRLGAPKSKNPVTPFFPRYLFVRFDADVRQWLAISSSVGVHDILRGSDGQPAPVATSLVDRIRSWEVDGAIPPPPPPVPKAGDHVVVTKGAWAGVDAIVQKVKGTDRVTLLLSFASQPESSFKFTAHGTDVKIR